MPKLSSSQRSHLKGLAHSLKTMVQLGKNGMTEATVQTVCRALDDHELIKVRFLSHVNELEEVSGMLADHARRAEPFKVKLDSSDDVLEYKN